MPKRKALNPDPSAFERMARELGCDEDPEAFERVFARIVPPKRPARAVGFGEDRTPDQAATRGDQAEDRMNKLPSARSRFIRKVPIA